MYLHIQYLSFYRSELMFCQTACSHFLRSYLWCLVVVFFLKGLNALQNLKELNLADNVIEKIGRLLEILLFTLPSLIEIH